jgi:hypothetical protein
MTRIYTHTQNVLTQHIPVNIHTQSHTRALKHRHPHTQITTRLTITYVPLGRFLGLHLIAPVLPPDLCIPASLHNLSFSYICPLLHAHTHVLIPAHDLARIHSLARNRTNTPRAHMHTRTHANIYAHRKEKTIKETKRKKEKKTEWSRIKSPLLLLLLLLSSSSPPPFLLLLPNTKQNRTKHRGQ